MDLFKILLLVSLWLWIFRGSNCSQFMKNLLWNYLFYFNFALPNAFFPNASEGVWFAITYLVDLEDIWKASGIYLFIIWNFFSSLKFLSKFLSFLKTKSLLNWRILQIFEKLIITHSCAVYFCFYVTELLKLKYLKFWSTCHFLLHLFQDENFDHHTFG